MVSAKIFGHKDNLRVYISLFQLIKGSAFQTLLSWQKLSKSLGNDSYTKLYIEDVAYQLSLVQSLQASNLPAEGVRCQVMIRDQDWL